MRWQNLLNSYALLFTINSPIPFAAATLNYHHPADLFTFKMTQTERKFLLTCHTLLVLLLLRSILFSWYKYWFRMSAIYFERWTALQRVINSVHFSSIVILWRGEIVSEVIVLHAHTIYVPLIASESHKEELWGSLLKLVINRSTNNFSRPNFFRIIPPHVAATHYEPAQVFLPFSLPLQSIFGANNITYFCYRVLNGLEQWTQYYYFALFVYENAPIVTHWLATPLCWLFHVPMRRKAN